MNRRTFLRRGASTGVSIGIAKALHNTVIGYGQFGIGENLREQSIDTLARESMPSAGTFQVDLAAGTITGVGDRITITDEDGDSFTTDRLPSDHALQPSLEAIQRLRSGAIEVRGLPLDRFFELAEAGTDRPAPVGVLRRERGPSLDPETATDVIGAPPASTAEAVRALAETFATRTDYDVPRYVAGSIDDNLLPWDGELRAPFRPTVSVERLAEDPPPSLFCGEYTLLANRVIESAPVHAQRPPVAGFQVLNRRHKHLYNGLATVVADGEELSLLLTFIDYMKTTLEADVGLELVTGRKLNAYDRRHRADVFIW